MKTKEEILKMTKAEIAVEFQILRKSKPNYCCSGCSGCSDCYDCSGCYDCYCCSGCSDCSDCYGCSHCYGEKYMILNVQFTKKEYEAKMKEQEK